MLFSLSLSWMLFSLLRMLSLSRGCSLSHFLPLSIYLWLKLYSLSLSRMLFSLARVLFFLYLSLADALFSLAYALSLTYPLSLSILWFVVIFALVVFSSLTTASIWIDRADVSLLH
jgi:hypothetical protein